MINSTDLYSAEKMHIVKVLLNDKSGKLIFIHTKFSHALDKDAIVILQKSPFPNDVTALCDARFGRIFVDDTGNNCLHSKSNEFNSEDLYHDFVVNSGLEKLNAVNMTVIHPAQPEHFSKYTASKRHIMHETPEIYNNVLLPLLRKNPNDLAWVDNLIQGKSESERVLFSNHDDKFGFLVALDLRWNGSQLCDLHCLAMAKSSELTCLRDLNRSHVPMLKEMLLEGRRCLVEKYNGYVGVDDSNECEPREKLREDQIIAYFHYPPTFYRLHMHFIHVDGAADGGTQSGKAHLAEDVIENLELKSDFYSTRNMQIYLYENYTFFDAIRSAQ